jgi:uncharacterized protein with GYD domain
MTGYPHYTGTTCQGSFKRMIAAPEDASEAVNRLITQVGGKLIAYYLTSGDYDVLLIFEAPSYEDAVPALIVAAAENGVADLKTMMALTSSEMKKALVKAGSIATSNHPTTASLSRSERADPSNSDPQRGGTADEAQADIKTATAILDARKKAIDNIKAEEPAPYYLASTTAPAPSRAALSPPSINRGDASKK